jgi:hypothetical protein
MIEPFQVSFACGNSLAERSLRESEVRIIGISVLIRNGVGPMPFTNAD